MTVYWPTEWPTGRPVPRPRLLITGHICGACDHVCRGRAPYGVRFPCAHSHPEGAKA